MHLQEYIARLQLIELEYGDVDVLLLDTEKACIPTFSRAGMPFLRVAKESEPGKFHIVYKKPKPESENVAVILS